MSSEDEIQVVAFRVGPQEFALDILQVERILRYARAAPVPKAPAFLEGVLTYEGGAVPVVDLRKRLDLPDPIAEETRIMILGLDEQRIGIVVDEVREVIRVDSTAIASPPPMVRGLAAPYVAGIITRGDRTIIMLQALRLLNATERLTLTKVGA